MLGYCWLLALFLSRSARCFTRVQGEVDSAPTYLTAIFSLAYQYYFNLILHILLILERKEGRKRKRHCFVVPLCLYIHWLVLMCALTRDQTCNLGILGGCSNGPTQPGQEPIPFKWDKRREYDLITHAFG